MMRIYTSKLRIALGMTLKNLARVCAIIALVGLVNFFWLPSIVEGYLTKSAMALACFLPIAFLFHCVRTGALKVGRRR